MYRCTVLLLTRIPILRRSPRTRSAPPRVFLVPEEFTHDPAHIALQNNRNPIHANLSSFNVVVHIAIEIGDGRPKVATPLPVQKFVTHMNASRVPEITGARTSVGSMCTIVTYRSIDNAQYYANEAGVGRAIARCDIPCDEISSRPRCGIRVKEETGHGLHSTRAWPSSGPTTSISI